LHPFMIAKACKHNKSPYTTSHSNFHATLVISR
jgi:hypothetical protein